VTCGNVGGGGLVLGEAMCAGHVRRGTPALETGLVWRTVRVMQAL